MTIPSDFSNAYINNIFGVVTGTAAGTAFPSVPGPGLYRLHIDPNNVGECYLGNAPSNCVFQVAAGDDLGWFSLNDLNQLSHRDTSGSSSYWHYWVQR